jgi:predicted MPP superfamily phosphohydrolase
MKKAPSGAPGIGGRIVKALDTLMAATLLASGGLWLYARYVEPRWVEITRLTIALPGLPEQFDGYRIVHISDIQAGKWLHASRLEEAVRLVNREEPDLIAITGDFVTYTYPEAPERIVPTLRHLRARDGVAAVLGNHDYWGLGPDLIRHIIAEAGMIDLNNDAHSIERDGAALRLAGLDSARESMARLDETLRKLPKEGTAILLAHEPDVADLAASTGRFSLQLSGHSHGGQVVAPFIGPPLLPPMGRKYYAGLKNAQGMKVYTNRGLGVVGLPVRFLCRPEITVITLTSGGKAI